MKKLTNKLRNCMKVLGGANREVVNQQYKKIYRVYHYVFILGLLNHHLHGIKMTILAAMNSTVCNVLVFVADCQCMGFEETGLVVMGLLWIIVLLLLFLLKLLQSHFHLTS